MKLTSMNVSSVAQTKSTGAAHDAMHASGATSLGSQPAWWRTDERTTEIAESARNPGGGAESLPVETTWRVRIRVASQRQHRHGRAGAGTA